jgi:hypothetical protein
VKVPLPYRSLTNAREKQFDWRGDDKPASGLNGAG